MSNDADATPANIADLQKELERLRQENESLRGGVEPADVGPSESRHRGRWFASLTLIVIGSLLVPVSVLSLWLNRTITDTDRYVETVAPLARDADIQKAVASRIETALFENVDIQSEVAGVLPEQASVLAAPITAGIQTLAGDIINRVIKSDQFAQLWDTANRAAQEQVVSVLTNSSGKKGVVEIDLTETAKEVSSKLTDLGLPFFSDVGSKPVKFEVFQSDEVAAVQTAFSTFDTLATILPWLTLLILGAGVLVAPRRRKGLVYAATGWVLSSALLLIMVAIGRAVYLDALPTGASLPANEAFFDTISRFLRGGGRSTLVMGLVILTVALVTGPSAPAVGLRSFVSRVLGSAGAGADQKGVDFGPVGAFVARNLMALRIVVGVIALIVFLAQDQPSAGTVLWIAVIALVVLGIIEVIGRAGEHHQLSSADGSVAVGSSSGQDQPKPSGTTS